MLLSARDLALFPSNHKKTTKPNPFGPQGAAVCGNPLASSAWLRHLVHCWLRARTAALAWRLLANPKTLEQYHPSRQAKSRFRFRFRAAETQDRSASRAKAQADGPAPPPKASEDCGCCATWAHSDHRQRPWGGFFKGKQSN